MTRYYFILVLVIMHIAAFSQTDGYVNIKRGQLYYQVIGEGKPLLLINGGPGISSNHYESIARELNLHRQIILFDHRGVGQSIIKGSSSITTRNILDDLEKLRNHLAIEKWDVLGISFGGFYALNYLSEHSENIDKLILISSLPYNYTEGEGVQRIPRLKEEDLGLHERAFVDSIKSTGPENIYYSGLNRALRARFYLHNKQYLPILMNWFYNIRKPNTKIMSRYVELKPVKDIKQKLKRVNNSALILYGVNDFINLSSPLSINQALKNSRLEILEDCGHSILIEKFTQAQVKLIKFLNEE